ncbi:hypothetical protein C8R45DRAFT_1157581 [Mycena sanguinolenta]|nr:hypothetical protein C8R45DRAFT_1157581 [Mycena sanguinolenta]
MEPLKLSALPDVEDWGTFKLDMKGFIPPQKMDLWPGCANIQDQLRHFTSSDFVRDNDAPFIALSVSKKFPTTRLTICEETFAVPVSSRDMAFLATHLGNGAGSRHTVSATKVSILSDAAKKMIGSTSQAVLTKLKALDGDGGHKIIFGGLDAFKAGSHYLETTPTDENHYATIFLVLPTFTDSVDICVRAAHDSVVSRVKCPKGLSQTACAVDTHIEVGPGNEVICLTYYASVDPDSGPSQVIPTLQGTLPPLRDGFCLWRHKLDCGVRKTPKIMLFLLVGHPGSAKDFNGDDAALLCHLAPLAKVYGFNIYIAQLHLTMSTTQEIQHPYKEYDFDFDPSVLEMPDDEEVVYKWKELRSLGGVPVEPQDLLKPAEKMVKTDEYLKDRLADLDVQEHHDFVDDTSYYSTVRYTHSFLNSAYVARKVSILFIAP